MGHNADAKKALRAAIPEHVNESAVTREAWLEGADAAVDALVVDQSRASIQRLDNAAGSTFQLVVDSKIESEHPNEAAAQARAQRFGGAAPWGSA